MGMASIKEGNVTRNFSGIDRLLLKTSVSGSETSVWIPESKTALDTLSVKKNGAFVVPDGVYGWKTVYVGVDKSRESITGKKNGQPVIVRRSSNGGGGSGGSGSGTSGAETPLITENLPAKIAVTTNPTKTAYLEGETIDYSGIVVTAYNADDTVWTNSEYPNGTVPFNELTFPVTTAEKGGGSASDPYIWIPVMEIDAEGTSGLRDEYCPTKEQVMAYGLHTLHNEAKTYVGEVVVKDEYVLAFYYVNHANYHCLDDTKAKMAYISTGTEQYPSYEPFGLVHSEKVNDYSSSRYSNSFIQLYSRVYYQHNGQITSEGCVCKPDSYVYSPRTIVPYGYPMNSLGDGSYSADWIGSRFHIYTSRDEAFAALNDGVWEEGASTVSVPVQWQSKYQADPYEASFDISVT